LPSQNLVEKIVRSKIYDCQYWKEHCFGLTAESLIDKARHSMFIICDSLSSLLSQQPV